MQKGTIVLAQQQIVGSASSHAPAVLMKWHVQPVYYQQLQEVEQTVIVLTVLFFSAEIYLDAKNTPY